MAENETLDLMDRHSVRWRKLRERIRNNDPIEAIADEGVACLTRTFKSLSGLLPIRELLDANRQGVDAVRKFARRCSKAPDYAELFAQQAAILGSARPYRDPVELVAGVLRATLDKFLDQIGMEVVGSGPWPDMARFRILREQLGTQAADRIDRLAKQIAEHPDKKPRMPRKSAALKDREHHQLLTLSLRSGTRG